MKNLQIESYRLDELKNLDFSDSDILPISSLRIKSYLNNPRAEASDKVLFLAKKEEKIIGFRTAFPDSIFTGKEVVRFVTLSGSWTHPEHRRKGISSILLKKVMEEWNGLIFYSNYAPGAHKLLSGFGEFEVWKSLVGAKFFIKAPLENIIGKRFPELAFSTPILRIFDLSANAFVNKKQSATSKLSFQKIEKIEGEDSKFITSFLQKKSGLLRGSDELNWIIENPWISDDSLFAKAQTKYPFTLFTKVTKRLCFSIKEKNQTIGFLMIFQKNEQITVPYLYVSDDSLEKMHEIAQFIKKHVLELKASTLLIAEPTLADFYKKTGGYIFSKKRNQNYFATKKLINRLGSRDDYSIFDGDGDHVFSN